MMMMTDDGDWWYVTCSRFNYFGWNDFTIGRQKKSAVTGTSMYPTYRTGDSASYKGGTVSYINSTRWAASWVYANSYQLFAGGNDADAQGSGFLWNIGTSSTSIDDANCAVCIVGNDADDVYFKIELDKRLIPVSICTGSTTLLRQYRGVDDSNLRICPPQRHRFSRHR